MALENRSLDRGITVLEALAEGGAMSLQNLHAATGLPKSTLRRLLATLVARRIVRVGLGDKLYRTNIALPELAPVDLSPRAARLVEAAVPHMIELTRKIGWPSDLHLFSKDCMWVVESTRTLSPYHLHRSAIDIKVSVFGSAGGRAFLSAQDDAEVSRIAEVCGDDPKNGLARLGISLQTLCDELAEIRAKGFAIRHPAYPPVSTRDDRLRVMAVPLLREGASVGALTLMWPRNYLTADAFAEAYLEDLRLASKKISETLGIATTAAHDN
ncbi:MAG: helix-turn-helix domain-containing protein [Beijerinckiaceae bacterium]